jgi:hypothetical protein
MNARFSLDTHGRIPLYSRPSEASSYHPILFVNMDDASQIPAIGEPWFLALNATVEFQRVMKMEDLLKAGASIEKAVHLLPR